MSEETSVTFMFNRRYTKAVAIFFGMFSPIALMMPVFFLGATIMLIYQHIWAFSVLSMVEFLVYTSLLPTYLKYLVALKQKNPAVIICKDGITENVSGNMLGLLRWKEIQRMYPWTLEYQPFANRFLKTPVIAKHKGVVIILKENYLLKQIPWLNSLWVKFPDKAGRFRWIFVPEKSLDVTADDFMHRLNQFYVKQVRDVA